MAEPVRKGPKVWRMVCALLLLAVIAAIWVTRADQLLANNRAYPVTLLVVGLFAVVLLWSARPRRANQTITVEG